MPPDVALVTAAQRINVILEAEAGRAPQPLEPGAVPADAKRVSFWYYAHPLISPALGGAGRVAAFQSAFPDVLLEAQFIGEWHYAVQKLTVSLAAGGLPDVALVKRAWFARLMASGRIAPLDELLPAAFLADLRSPSRKAFLADGCLWGVPGDGFCSVLVYNRQMADTAPKTWEDLRRMARSMSRQDKHVYLIGDVPFLETLWSAGGYVCNEKTSGLDAPQARDALEFLLSLRREGLAHPTAFGNPTYAFELFLSGKVAMTVISSELLPRTQQAAFSVGIAPVPGKTAPLSLMSDNVIVVFGRYAYAKREGIAALLDFLTGPEVQGAGAVAVGSVPVRQSVAEGVTVPAGLAEAYLAGRSTPLVAPWSAIESEMYRYLDLAYRWQGPTS